MKLVRKISGILTLTMLLTSVSAQDANCYIKKSFVAPKGTTLWLSNKYGDINIIASHNDSISVCATITIDQNNKELIQKSMSLVTVNIDRLRDTISISTSYDKLFFTQAYRQGRKSFSVDYMIKMPAYTDIKITNEFGNVAIGELSGLAQVTLSRGIFTAKKLTRGNTKPLSSIYVSNGNVNIDTLNWMYLKVRNCPTVSIGAARAMVISSTLSKISTGNIGSLVSDSKYDTYNVESVNNLESVGLYSIFEIKKFSGKLKSENIYGSISVSNINKDFSSIDIISNHTPVTINTGEGVSFIPDIRTTNTPVEFPSDNYPDVSISESNNTTIITGTAGDNMQAKSIIKIRATSGRLTIR